MLGWESVVWAWRLEHFFKVVRSAFRGLPATFTVGDGHERVVAPLLLILSLGGTVGGAFVGGLVPPRLAVGALEDGSDCFLSRGMTGGDVQEFLGGSRAPASQLVDQGFAGRSRQKGSYHVGVGDVRELIALSGKAPDVPAEGFIGFLTAVLEVPWVSRAFIRALEITHEDLSQIRPALNSIGR